MKNLLLITTLFFLSVSVFAQSDRLIASSYKPTAKAQVASVKIGANYLKTASDNIEFTLSAYKSQRGRVYVLDKNKEIMVEKEIQLYTTERTFHLNTYELTTGKYTLYVQGDKGFAQADFFVSH